MGPLPAAKELLSWCEELLSAASEGLPVLGRDVVVCIHMAGKADEAACEIRQQAQEGELMAAKVSSLKRQG